MLVGTICEVEDHGSIFTAMLMDAEGSTHPVYGDARAMSHFLDRVLEVAREEGCKPYQVEVAASNLGMAAWLSLASEVDANALELVEA